MTTTAKTQLTTRPESPVGSPAAPALFCLARALIGVAFLRRAVGGRSAGMRSRGFSRGVLALLGVRHIVQALASVRPTRAVLMLGAEADGAHSASMAGAALMPRPWRRVALLDGLLAGSLAVTGLAIARLDVCDPELEPAFCPGRSSWLARRDRWAARAARFLVPDWPGVGR